MIGCKIKDVGKVQLALFNKKNEERKWGGRECSFISENLIFQQISQTSLTAK